MGYEIPQEIQYKEIIMFGLNWKQLFIVLITFFPTFFIITRNVSSEINYFLALPIVLLGLGFMFFDLDKKIKAFIGFKIFQKASSNDNVMKKYLNIQKIQNNTLILKNNKKVGLVQVDPINFQLKSNIEREGIDYGFQKFLNGLNFSVQFLITTNKEDNIYNRNFYIITQEKNNLELETNYVVKKLQEVGLKSQRLTDNGIIRVFNEFFKQNNTEVKIEELRKDFTHYLLSPKKIQNYKNYLVQDGVYCRVISAVGYPRSVEFGFLNKIIKLQKNIDISVHVEPFSIEKLTVRLNKELQKQKADLYIISQKGSINPALEIKYADTRKVLEDLQKGEEKLFLISLYINCKSNDLQELEEITQNINGELNSLLIIPEVPKYLQAKAFKSCLPYCQNLLDCKRNITTKPLSAFFPFTSKFYTKEEDGITFGNNENNLPVSKNIFRLSNHNGVILASSGGGKSYLAKLLVQRFHKKGIKVFIIDPEGEYVSIVQNLGGQVIDIGIGRKNNINPLDLMGHSYETKRLSLHEVFYLMFNNLGDLQRSFIDNAVSKVYDNYFREKSRIEQELSKKKEELMQELNDDKKVEEEIKNLKENTERRIIPTITDVYRVILNRMESLENPVEKNTLAAITYRMSVYVNGAFSFLNKKTNINLEKDIVCFHLKDLPTVIQPVLMYLIMDFLYLKMKNAGGEKLLLVDEAWSLISKTDENSLLFKIIKTCRKYQMGVFLISQEVEDLISNKVGKALLSNSSTTILLKQKPNVINQLSQVFNLNKEEIGILVNASVGNSIMFFEDYRQQVYVTSSDDEHELITQKPLQVEVNEEDKQHRQLLCKPYYLLHTIKKDEQNYLLDHDYVLCDVVPINKGTPSRVILKKRNREGVQSSFLVYNIAEFIQNLTNRVQASATSNPDIIFECNNKKYAIEVETGSNVIKDNKIDRIQEKIHELKNEFGNNILFVLTDSRYFYHYKKYGKVFNRNTIIKYISKLFEARLSLPNYGKNSRFEKANNTRELHKEDTLSATIKSNQLEEVK